MLLFFKKYEAVRNAYNEAENFFAQKRGDITEKRKLGKYSKEVGAMYSHHYKLLNNTLRYGHLVSICSVLEDSIQSFCRQVDSYDKKRIERSRNGKNWLDKHLDFLIKGRYLNTSRNLRQWRNVLRHIIVLRNCIVHAWGNIDTYQHSSQAETTVSYFKRRSRKYNCDYVSVTKDRYIFLGSNICNEAFWASKKLMTLLEVKSYALA